MEKTRIVMLNIDGVVRTFFVDGITQKILDRTEYIGTIGKAVNELSGVKGEVKLDVVISDENNKDILRVQLHSNNAELTIREI